MPGGREVLLLLQLEAAAEGEEQEDDQEVGEAVQGEPPPGGTVPAPRPTEAALHRWASLQLLWAVFSR